MRRKHDESITDTVNRVTEEIALRHIAFLEEARSLSSGRILLPNLHYEALRLERAAMQYMPHWDCNDVYEFVANILSTEMTRRDVIAILTDCEFIIEYAVYCDIDLPIDDMPKKHFDNLMAPKIKTPKRRRRQRVYTGTAYAV